MTEERSYLVRANGEDWVVKLKYETTNFSKHPALIKSGLHKDRIVPFLAMYDALRDITIVDERAPKWYKELAALHEMMCCGRKFEELLSSIPNPILRCREVERLVMNNAGDYREEYCKIRTRMFDFILQNNLIAPDFRDGAQAAQTMLILADK